MSLALERAIRSMAARTIGRAAVAMTLAVAALPVAAQDQLWIRQLGTGGSDAAQAAAPDGAGGEYVGGLTSSSLAGPSAGSVDAWLARYDSAGNQHWIRQLGTSSWDEVNSAAIDAVGGTYVSGSTDGDLGGSNAGDLDAWLARFDGAGNQLWIRQLGTRAGDSAYAAVPDASGGVLVSGISSGDLAGPNAGGDDAWIARYDSAGNLLWVRQFGSDSWDEVAAAASDGAGGAYVSGWTSGSLGGAIGGTFDAWLARYDQAGNQLWVRQIGTSVDDYSRAVAPDGSGGVIVSGWTDGSLGGPSAGSGDAWLARYDGPCSAGTTYCTASGTSIPGCQAAIGAVGTPSVANPSGFTITSGSVPGGNNVGICFFGDNGAASIPFGTLGGFVCVQPPFYRSGAKTSGGSQGTCNGNFGFALLDLINASPIVLAGATIHAEIWARDPANPDGFLLSDGLAITVCP